MTPGTRGPRELDPRPRTVRFAGYDWRVKSSGGDPVGPGGNYFSDSESTVCVTSSGALRLAITRAGSPGVERWTCAEGVNTAQLGYGTYRWELRGDVTALAPQAVLGMFTWSDAPTFAHRELDIELSRWSDPAAPLNGGFVVQTDPADVHRFALKAAATSLHTITWTPSSVVFGSTAAGTTHAWTWRPSLGHPLPIPGDESPRINLWLHDHRPPSLGACAIEVASFSFT